VTPEAPAPAASPPQAPRRFSKRVVAGIAVVVAIVIFALFRPPPEPTTYRMEFNRFVIPQGPEIITVYAVVEDPAIDLYKVAQECSRFYRRSYDSSSCYIFDSERALRAARVDEVRGGMERLCWRSFWSQGTGATAGAEDNPDYAAEGCPEPRTAATASPASSVS